MNIKEFKKETGIHITTEHTGKMDGMASLSTSVLLNPICQARAKNKDSICSKCYASRMAKMYKGLEKNLGKNTEALTGRDIETWPTLNYRVFRLEAFGDLCNTIQVANYFRFCESNDETRFTLWTKNPEIIAVAIKEGHAKPRNLIIMQSSRYVNKVDAPLFDFIDGVFTVFTKEYAKEHDIEINCGARHCLTCLKCYTKQNEVMYINELLK